MSPTQDSPAWQPPVEIQISTANRKGQIPLQMRLATSILKAQMVIFCCISELKIEAGRLELSVEEKTEKLRWPAYGPRKGDRERNCTVAARKGFG
jgi:hypothetical protein